MTPRPRASCYGTTTVCGAVATLAPHALLDVTATMYDTAATIPDRRRLGVA